MLELAKLQNAKPNGSKIIARCPVCASQGQDKKSDHLAYWTDKETYHCIAGCDTKEIFSLVGIPKEREPKPKKRRIVATYDYTNAQGELIHQSIKYDPKGYGQRRPDGKRRGESVEHAVDIDAMKPADLRGILAHEVESFVDPWQLKKMREIEEAERETLMTINLENI